MQALHEVTRGDGAWHNYYRSRITPPAGVRRSLRSRGANLPEYSLPRELISVVIIISPRPRLGAIASEFSRLLRNESFGRKCLRDRIWWLATVEWSFVRIILSSGVQYLRTMRGTFIVLYLLTIKIFSCSRNRQSFAMQNLSSRLYTTYCNNNIIIYSCFNVQIIIDLIKSRNLKIRNYVQLSLFFLFFFYFNYKKIYVASVLYTSVPSPLI